VTTGNDGSWSQPVPPPTYPPQGGAGQFGPPAGYPTYPPAPGYHAQPAPPTRRRWPWIVGGIIAAVVLVVAGLLAVVFTVAKDDQPQAVNVIYEVTGTGSAEITYHGQDGGFTGPLSVTLPWQKQVTMGGEHTYVEVTVERPKSSEQPMKCRITADGKVLKEDESVGTFVFCDGRVGES
jgi:hypothetical protein